MGSHTPVVYTTDQFKWYSSKQTFYTNVKMLTAFKHGNKKFKRKKKFIIVNPKTNVGVEFISNREYTNTYKFRSKSGYICYVFKPMFNPDDWQDISPVRFLKIYPTDEHKKYYVYYKGDRKKIYINYNLLGTGPYGTTSTMNKIYKKLGIKRLLTISVQDALDKGCCMSGIIHYLRKFTSQKFPYVKQLKAWGKNCPTFILEYKVTFVVTNYRWDVYKKFKEKARFCPIEKLLLKKG